MYLNFRTVYLDSNSLLVDGWTSALQYARGFFLIDLVSTVPWQTVLSSSNAALGFTKLFRVGKLVKFARVIKLFRVLKLRRVCL